MPDHVRLLLAPAGQRVGPLARPAELVRALAERDRVAVDEAGDDRCEAVRRGEQHRLVEQTQPLLGSPEADERVGLVLGGEGDEVVVAEPLADPHRLGGTVVSCLVVAARSVREHPRNQQIAALDVVAAGALQEPLGPREPPVGRRRLAVQHPVEAEPEGRSRSAPGVVPLDVGPVRPLQRTDVLLVVAEHVGRGREQLEIARGQRVGLIGGGERLVGVPPGPSLDGLAALLEIHSHPGHFPVVCNRHARGVGDGCHPLGDTAARWSGSLRRPCTRARGSWCARSGGATTTEASPTARSPRSMTQSRSSRTTTTRSTSSASRASPSARSGFSSCRRASWTSTVRRRLECAQRELVEEIGRRRERLAGAEALLHRAGFADEAMTLFLATGLERVEGHEPDPEERIEIVAWPLDRPRRRDRRVRGREVADRPLRAARAQTSRLTVPRLG